MSKNNNNDYNNVIKQICDTFDLTHKKKEYIFLKNKIRFFYYIKLIKIRKKSEQNDEKER